MNLLIVVLITTLAFTPFSYSTAVSRSVCNETEKEALLNFKNGLIDPSNRLASWVGSENCCNWAGVVCQNWTGHVLELHLRGIPYPDQNNPHYLTLPLFNDAAVAYNRSCLGGKISNSLLNLSHLHYLDLSNNNFGSSPIPEFFGSMQSLRHLNLSNAGFGGMIPPQLGNLSNLLYLSIGHEVRFIKLFDLRYLSYVENLHWISGLSMLKHLDLNSVNLTKASDWLEQMQSLSSLKELHLNNCGLFIWNFLVPQLPYTNSSKLEILDLAYNNIGGPISNVLWNSTSLRVLDLSANNLDSSLPDWMGSFSQLERLMLRWNSNLHGDVSSAIGNLSFLAHLDLSDTSLQVQVQGSVRTLCNLQGVDFSGLSLEQGPLRTFLGCSFNKLQHLSLQRCNLSGPIPEYIGSLISLNYLDLSHNQLNSSSPHFTGSLASLNHLDLSYNQWNGSIPHFIGSLTSLNYLDLSHNQFNGVIPTSVGQLIQLEYLDLEDNLLEGTVSEVIFANLTILQQLCVSRNRIALEVSLDWVPPFQLTLLRLSSLQLGPKFPEWLRSQNRLSVLELDFTGIKDRVPAWFWDRSSQFHYVNLSHNGLYGEISGRTISADALDLSSNNFEGLLPSLTTQVYYLDLSNNSFSGSLSQFLCSEKAELSWLSWLSLGNNQLSGTIPNCWTSWQYMTSVDLQNNNLTGNIPDAIFSLTRLTILQLNNNSLSGLVPLSLQNSTQLYTLDLSHNLLSGPLSQFLCLYPSWIPNQLKILRLGKNQFSGNIPNCWKNWPWLESLELQEKKLSGMLPDSIGSLSRLKSLYLRRNNLFGELPPSLQQCTKLMILDIGENNFSGSLPEWIGESFNSMKFIGFRSNNFQGNIPYKLCALQDLQILDLANNKLSGQIPRCILNFSSMANEDRAVWGYNVIAFILNFMPGTRFTFQQDSANLVNKGLLYEYTSILHFMVAVDLSNNSLSGQIPEEITNLAALVSLNLSSNMLSGRIPKNMGNMSSLESLDLSFNQLSGEIPQKMATMTTLSYLNLSYNHLTGKIPTSTQFLTFNQSSFLGNNLTIGNLVPNNSGRNWSDLASRDHHGVEFNEFYVSLALGFVVGFGLVVSPLLYSKSWRMVYFQTINDILDRLWVLIVLPIRVRIRRQV